jgi:hypothetical protein
MKFSDTQPKQDLDPDRIALTDGMKIHVEKIIVSDQTKYEAIVKIDGLRLPERKPGKWYTTSSVIASQIKRAMQIINAQPDGVLKEAFDCQIRKTKGKNGNSYLEMVDL